MGGKREEKREDGMMGKKRGDGESTSWRGWNGISRSWRAISQISNRVLHLLSLVEHHSRCLRDIGQAQTGSCHPQGSCHLPGQLPSSRADIEAQGSCRSPGTGTRPSYFQARVSQRVLNVYFIPELSVHHLSLRSVIAYHHPLISITTLPCTTLVLAYNPNRMPGVDFPLNPFKAITTRVDAIVHHPRVKGNPCSSLSPSIFCRPAPLFPPPNIPAMDLSSLRFS